MVMHVDSFACTHSTDISSSSEANTGPRQDPLIQMLANGASFSGTLGALFPPCPMGSRMYVTQHGAVPATWSCPGVGIVACSCHEPRASSSVKSLLDTLPAATAASSLGPQSGKKWLMPALLSLSPSRCKGCLQAHTTSCYHTALEASAVPHMLRSSGIAQVDMNGSKTLSVSFGYISVREKTIDAGC